MRSRASSTFILRQDYNGFEVNTYLGRPTRAGGGSVARGGFVWGTGTLVDQGYNLMISGNIDHEQELFGRDRSFATQDFDFKSNLFDGSGTPTGRIQPWVLGVSANAQPGSSIGNVQDSNCAKNGNYYDPLYGTCRYNIAPLVGLIPQM